MGRREVSSVVKWSEV